MTRYRVLRRLLVLTVLTAPGCAGVEPLPTNTPDDRNYAARVEEEKHADLERELSLYSD